MFCSVGIFDPVRPVNGNASARLLPFGADGDAFSDLKKNFFGDDSLESSEVDEEKLKELKMERKRKLELHQEIPLLILKSS